MLNRSKKFIYHIGHTSIETTEAFGMEWNKAIAIATSKHLPIFRTRIDSNEIAHEEFYTGCMFLEMRFMKDAKLHIF